MNEDLKYTLMVIGMIYTMIKHKSAKAALTVLREIDLSTLGLLVGLFALVWKLLFPHVPLRKIFSRKSLPWLIAGAALTALLPVYKPLIKRINTSVEVAANEEMGTIDISGEDA